MNLVVFNPRSLIEWSVAAQPAPGQQIAADMHFVSSTRTGALLAVVDGLGHGEEAMIAALKAVAILKAHTHESVVALTQRCHAGLAATRGWS